MKYIKSTLGAVYGRFSGRNEQPCLNDKKGALREKEESVELQASSLTEFPDHVAYLCVWPKTNELWGNAIRMLGGESPLELRKRIFDFYWDHIERGFAEAGNITLTSVEESARLMGKPAQEIIDSPPAIVWGLDGWVFNQEE